MGDKWYAALLVLQLWHPGIPRKVSDSKEGQYGGGAYLDWA